ncbi:MAG: hypothetical protein Q4F75_00955, partial [Pseudomonadota bacterium]|nr:hypothetical protein [Pseudomonadota bacterium]
MRRFYFFIINFFIMSVAKVFILFCSNSNDADYKKTIYTREELETKLNSDLQEKKQKSEAVQAAIDELQKELDTYGMGPLLRVSEKGGFYKDPEYEKLQQQVYHGEITDEEYKKQKKQLEK